MILFCHSIWFPWIYQCHVISSTKMELTQSLNRIKKKKKEKMSQDRNQCINVWWENSWGWIGFKATPPNWPHIEWLRSRLQRSKFMQSATNFVIYSTIHKMCCGSFHHFFLYTNTQTKCRKLGTIGFEFRLRNNSILTMLNFHIEYSAKAATTN